MSDEPQAELSLIARQQRQLLAEMGTIRDDMRGRLCVTSWPGRWPGARLLC
jgi:hypothetical protein